LTTPVFNFHAGSAIMRRRHARPCRWSSAQEQRFDGYAKHAPVSALPSEGSGAPRSELLPTGRPISRARELYTPWLEWTVKARGSGLLVLARGLCMLHARRRHQPGIICRPSSAMNLRCCSASPILLVCPQPLNLCRSASDGGGARRETTLASSYSVFCLLNDVYEDGLPY
jgi:hypothetical protein